MFPTKEESTMNLARVTVSSETSIIDPVSADFITYLMHEFVKKYDCSELVFNIYWQSPGMPPAVIAKVDASSRDIFPMGDYTYTYRSLEAFAEAAIKPYFDTGRFPGNHPAIFHDDESIAWGMVLDAEDYELVIGLTVAGPKDFGYLVCGCLAQLLLFCISTKVKRESRRFAFERDTDTIMRLAISAGKIWEHLFETQSIQAIEAFSCIEELIRSDHSSIRTMRDILICG